jgi:histidyl-tRNA synthetase
MLKTILVLLLLTGLVRLIRFGEHFFQPAQARTRLVQHGAQYDCDLFGHPQDVRGVEALALVLDLDC